MGYKEKYEQALERAKKLQANAKGLILNKWLYNVFPELKENEDDRIRNNAIQIISSLMNGVNVALPLNIYKECIAWLEKQGKQKPIIEGTFVDVDEVRENFMQEVYRVLDADSTNDRANQIIDAFDHLPTITIQKPTDKVEPKFKVGDKIKLAEEPKYPAREIIAIKNDAYYFDTVEHLPFSNQDKWKLVEQTPADKIKQNPTWNEDDEKMFIGIISIVGDWYNSMSEKEKEYYGDCGYINWFKSLKERVQPQPKQDWSEDDKEMLDSAIAFVEHSAFTTIGKGKNNVISWLKSLKERMKGE